MQLKKRFEFVDLAKGVCIIMVIVYHIFPFSIPGLDSLRMPLYFILSGLFFKTYSGFGEFASKKINKILIPFLFFYLFGYGIFYFLQFFKPELLVTEASGISDLFCQRYFFNGPVWFLLALFWANLIFYIITTLSRSEWQRATAVVIIGAAGYMLGRSNFFLPCNIDSALSGLPFFYIGNLLKRTNILLPNRLDKYDIPAGIAFLVAAISIAYFSGNPTLYLHTNTFYGNIFAIYAISLLSVGGVLLLCKAIGRIPLISYFGRYSIIPLCTHHLVYRPVKVAVENLSMESDLWVIIITLLICLLLIPLCRRFIPRVTAQEAPRAIPRG